MSPPLLGGGYAQLLASFCEWRQKPYLGATLKMPNQKLDRYDYDKIRGLDDFDLMMLISEIHDHGWPMAQLTLALMPPSCDVERARRLAKSRRQQQTKKEKMS